MPTSIRTVRRRDNQQWILDWLIRTTGREINFAVDGWKKYPPEVKSHEMIPRVMGRRGRRAEEMARLAEEADHAVTAARLYGIAAHNYFLAQHAIYEDDNAEKIYLHGKLLHCHARRRELLGVPVERVEIPWEGKSVPALYYMVPGKPKAPAVLCVPGMDQCKESHLDPGNNHWVKRGMHCLVIDGPGQGEQNLRKVRVTADNYERAAAAIDWLVQRPAEVDASRIGVSGISFGSFWGLRIAAYDQRVKAVVTGAQCYGNKRGIFEQASPRFKQVFMYMAGYGDEDAFDAMAAELTLKRYAEKIRAATLLVTGEYDPLSTLQEAYHTFRALQGPKEIWVLENDFHDVYQLKGFAGMDILEPMADWLTDALHDKYGPDHAKELLIPEGGKGPYEAPGTPWLPDRFEKYRAF